MTLIKKFPSEYEEYWKIIKVATDGFLLGKIKEGQNAPPHQF